MSKYFIRKLCDKSIKIKSKKKHLNSQYHKSITMCIFSRYSVKNPDFLHIEKIIKNYILDYDKKLAFYIVICKWTLPFYDTIISGKSNRLYSIYACFYIRKFLLSKIKSLESYGHKFSHISEMNVTFITDLRNMTYEHYLNQPKSMLEWRLNALLAKNPEVIKKFINSSHPLIRKCQYINEDHEKI